MDESNPKNLNFLQQSMQIACMSLNDRPMRQERIFDAEGIYQRTVAGNVLLHREAAALLQSTLQRWLQRYAHYGILRILDLACGGAPVTIAPALAALPQIRCEYHGIDINRDQLARIRAFPFPAQVTPTITEGDAWALGAVPNATYDMIFIGLNTHHATIDELACAASHLHRILKPGGLFFNHDFFRPTRFPYLRRPDANSTDAATPHSESADWRDEFYRLDAACLHEVGIADDAIALILAHIKDRDYPVSTAEWRGLLEDAGLTVTPHDFHHTDHPLREYIAVVEAIKREAWLPAAQ